ncbi:unannotated protein [freshwater metagenome]|uniref:Unannotated protein n=1 Tax=freshwater metagenome TaxID=449393 RepID=A0A6J7E7A1_9ZZZZ
MILETLAWVALVLIGGVLARIDIREHRLPNRGIALLGAVCLILLGGAALAEHEPARVLRAVACGILLFVVLLVMAVAAPGGLGMGDVKFGLVTGIFLGWLGWTWLWWGTLLAFMLGGAWAMALLAGRRAEPGSRIPFGPFMLAGVLLSAGLSIV